MNWNNLKKMKCPSCGVILNIGKLTFACADCDFKISKEKFDGLVENLYHPQKVVDSRFKDINDNLSALNNFDRPIVTEDFSDSKILDNL